MSLLVVRHNQPEKSGSRWLVGAAITLLLTAILFVPTAAPAQSQEASVEPVILPLAGALERRQAEISGMAWYGDWLVLLPQFPWFDDRQQSFLYLLPKAEIIDFLDGRLAGPLTPQRIPFEASGIAVTIPGFEGFEAIAFAGDRVFVTVEADLGSSMQGWLLRGEIEPDLSRIRLDVESRTPIDPQASYLNMSDEAILLRESAAGLEILTFYEANGRLANPKPIANRFDAELRPLPSLPMPNVEYRITDATALDAEDRFWVSNYFWPGEVQILIGGSALSARLRTLFSRATLHPVERLVELEYSVEGIRYTATPPINLTLGDGDPRNWEGIVRLDNRGFLIATDRFPETILAFVASGY
jgi:hypothetical protein